MNPMFLLAALAPVACRNDVLDTLRVSQDSTALVESAPPIDSAASMESAPSDTGETDDTPPDTSETAIADSDDPLDTGPDPLSGDLDLALADAIIVGSPEAMYTARGLAMGDVDGDGLDDLLVTLPGHGAAALLYSPRSGRIEAMDGDAILLGTMAAGTGRSCAMGDLNADGLADLLVNEPYGEAGAVRVVFGPVSGTRSLADADASFEGGLEGDRAGHWSTVADTDGDSAGDLIVGAYGVDEGGSDAGAVYLVRGPLDGATGPDDAVGAFVGNAPNTLAGQHVGAGDTDGDGLADILVGATDWSGGPNEAGAVYLLLGPATGTRSLDEADAAFLGLAARAYVGWTQYVADQDGDGYGDILLGAPGDSIGASRTGAVYVMAGPVAPGALLADAYAVARGESADDCAGTGVTAMDVDGDGRADIAIGAPGDDRGGVSAGTVGLLYGPIQGTVSMAAADARFIGDRSSDQAGTSMASGDADGDGRSDLLIGAEAAESFEGAAYLILGGP